MFVHVKCSTCDEVLGSIEKPEITELDIENYRQMVTCSNGHSSAELIEENE